MISKIYDTIETAPGTPFKMPGPLDKAFREIFESAAAGTEPPKIFFRADDIAPPSKNFTRMMELFQRYELPLCLAVVPSWLTPGRWDAMAPFRATPHLFCWHMHGYRHMNHEPQGKKCEFGPARNKAQSHRDLSRGMERLVGIMGDDLFPVFTPPWNRCNTHTLESLKALGIKAVSRTPGAVPPPPEGLSDIAVHVDLHTRKDKDAQSGWDKLINELEAGLSSGVCGIMLHHMRMNGPAFDFLEYLLALIAGQKQIRPVTYKELV